MVVRTLSELKAAYELRKRNPQALRDLYAKQRFNCHNCLYGVEVFRQICPIRCNKKQKFMSKSEIRTKCESYIPDQTVDRELRRILIQKKFKELEKNREKENAKTDTT